MTSKPTPRPGDIWTISVYGFEVRVLPSLDNGAYGYYKCEVTRPGSTSHEAGKTDIWPLGSSSSWQLVEAAAEDESESTFAELLCEGV